jgi:hypothetical protein
MLLQGGERRRAFLHVCAIAQTHSAERHMLVLCCSVRIDLQPELKPKGVSMKLHKPLLIAMCVASLGAASIPVAASAAVNVYFHEAPPPPRVEVVPAPRHGYVWVDGYWGVQGHHHAWKAGHWERERHGYTYNQSQWTQHDNRWELNRGGWTRNDRDGDGVPNSRDRAPDNPARQ